MRYSQNKGIFTAVDDKSGQNFTVKNGHTLLVIGNDSTEMTTNTLASPITSMDEFKALVTSIVTASSPSRGGKRDGAGRPKGTPTKQIRIDYKVYQMASQLAFCYSDLNCFSSSPDVTPRQFIEELIRNTYTHDENMQALIRFHDFPDWNL